MMAALGQFVFGLPTLAYQELQRSTAWRHPSNSRVGDRPARQYVGQGDDTITLTGLLVPEFMGDRMALDQLRDMADKGFAYNLCTGAGSGDGQSACMGAWVIEQISETGTIFVREGVARRVEFNLQLARVDDHLVDPAGGLGTGPEDSLQDYSGDPWDWFFN